MLCPIMYTTCICQCTARQFLPEIMSTRENYLPDLRSKSGSSTASVLREGCAATGDSEVATGESSS